jgi:hypothetical protein
MSTSFTGSEWREFCDDVGEDDAWHIACQIWDKEREQKLDEYKEYIEYLESQGRDTKEGRDLLDACYALYIGNTNVYHEIVDRLSKWIYDHGYEPIVYETDLYYRGRE